VTVGAGQMIIMKADGNTIPQPVDVDLTTLLKSSKLISADDLGPNSQQIRQAMQQQQEEIQGGDLVVTNMVIEGRGTLVSLNNNTATNVFKNVTIQDNNPPPPPNNPGGNNGNPNPNRGPDGPTFTGIAPLIAGTTVLNENSTVFTNPHVEAYNVQQGGVVTSNGIVYNGKTDGLLQYFVFGDTNVISPTLQPLLNDPVNAYGEPNSGDWAVFKFEKLIINGTPYFEFPYTTYYEGPTPPPIRDVVLASQTGILLGEASQFPGEVPEGAGGIVDPLCYGDSVLNLADDTLIQNFVLYAQTGNIEIRSSKGSNAIYGYNQNVTLVAASAQSDINVQGNINLETGGEYTTLTSNLNMIAGRDVNVTGVKVAADSVNIEAGQDANFNGAKVIARQRNLTVTAKRHINITNSSTLKALSYYGPDTLTKLVAQQGDINITDSTVNGRTVELEALAGHINLTNANSSGGDVFKATTYGPNGTINIRGNTNLSAESLVQLYAEGANGALIFHDNASLSSSSVKLAGNKVQIMPGKTVNVSASQFKVFANEHKYGTSATPSATDGNFSGSVPTPGAFGARHAPD
jgi:hypothetical protein